MKVFVEMEDWQRDQLRNYFGRNSRSSLEHWAFGLFSANIGMKREDPKGVPHPIINFDEEWTNYKS